MFNSEFTFKNKIMLFNMRDIKSKGEKDFCRFGGKKRWKIKKKNSYRRDIFIEDCEIGQIMIRMNERDEKVLFNIKQQHQEYPILIKRKLSFSITMMILYYTLSIISNERQQFSNGKLEFCSLKQTKLDNCIRGQHMRCQVLVYIQLFIQINKDKSHSSLFRFISIWSQRRMHSR